MANNSPNTIQISANAGADQLHRFQVLRRDILLRFTSLPVHKCYSSGVGGSTRPTRAGRPRSPRKLFSPTTTFCFAELSKFMFRVNVRLLSDSSYPLFYITRWHLMITNGALYLVIRNRCYQRLGS